ncbi:phosphotransferase [Microbacterium sp. NPDC096154]|uniref:phosphotransferase n=1 Tax=Microbacterium sp. NPDC096154 TaxID=3155549 RepID=UPI00332C3E0F
MNARGDRWFVRLTPISFGMAPIEWQNAVLRQLEERPLSVETPVLLPQRDGGSMSVVALGEDQYVLRVTTWVPGRSVAELGVTDTAFRRQLGRLAAEMIESLRPLNGAHIEQNEHHWMVVRSGYSIRSGSHAVEDAARRSLLDTAAAWFDQVEARIPALPQTVVHQDLHDFNVLGLRDEDGSARVSGVVDFNDAVFTAAVAELAVAAAYAGLRQPDAFSAFCDVVTGFCSRAELTDLEVDLLYPLAVARLAVNASTWSARGQAGNREYAASRSAATWPALEQLIAVDPEHARERFADIRLETAASRIVRAGRTA